MKKSPLILIGAIVIVIFLMFFTSIPKILAIWALENSPQFPGFKGYESSVPLKESSVRSSKLYYTKEKLFKKEFVYEQIYDSGATLDESRISDPDDSWLTCSHLTRTVFVDKELTYDCQGSEIKNGGRYVHYVARKEGRVIGVDASAIIHGTFLYFTFPADKAEEFASYDGWQEYFDAMKPKNLLFTPSEYEDPNAGV